MLHVFRGPHGRVREILLVPEPECRIVAPSEPSEPRCLELIRGDARRGERPIQMEHGARNMEHGAELKTTGERERAGHCLPNGPRPNSTEDSVGLERERHSRSLRDNLESHWKDNWIGR